MRRSIIITICIFNGILACFLIWYVFGRPNQISRPLAAPSQTAEVEPLDDTELWNRASEAKTTREAMHYLSRVQEDVFLLDSFRTLLTNLSKAENLPFDEWPFAQAAIQVYGAKAFSSNELVTLNEIARNESLPLTLRDSAFRSLVENTVRLPDDGEALNMTYGLIDSMYGEANSLSETSLQAEHFLSQKGIGKEDRDLRFRERLIKALSGVDETASKRITALNILTARNELDGTSFDQLYAGAGVQLQSAILKSVLQAKESVSYDWLNGIHASNPEQEQLIQQILE
jgi:hypothetical protein